MCLMICFDGIHVVGTLSANHSHPESDYATLLMIVNTVALNLFALVLCGFAAHITSITDSTIRSVQNQFSFGVADTFARSISNNTNTSNEITISDKLKDGDDDHTTNNNIGFSDNDTYQSLTQQIGVLNDLLSYAKQQGHIQNYYYQILLSNK